MNKDLKNDFYKLPDELLGYLTSTLKSTNKNVNGYERLSNLCKNKGVSYGQAKKIKHEMENGMEPDVYKLVGGDDLLKWIDDTLSTKRKVVDGIKRSKMNAGLPNQFKKPHFKNKSSNPSNVNIAKAQKSADEIINNRTVYESISRIKDIIKKII